VSGDGVITFDDDDDEFCYTWAGNIKSCGPMLRNPGGTQARENEFIWYSTRGAFTFSPAERM